MKLTERQQMDLDRRLKDLRNDLTVQEMKKFIQHGSVTTYEHVENVTRFSYWMNECLHLGADKDELVRGAFLHDYYLYDWHNGEDHARWHGFTHPGIACRNAKRRFQINKREQNIIASHMWPLVPHRLPMNRAAWIVCIADKCCSTKETIAMRRRK